MVQSAPGARLSSTVILARDADQGLEIFMVRRHPAAHVLASAYVFPGGTVRPDDASVWESIEDAGLLLAPIVNERSDQSVNETTARALFSCAVRELFEEAGVLFACTPQGEPAGFLNQPRETLGAARTRSQRQELSLLDLLDEWSLVPDVQALTPFSHWITPVTFKARYDTWFFVAVMPPDQEAVHCAVETTEGVWIRPQDAVAQADAGQFDVVFPTYRHLLRLLPYRTSADLAAFACSKPILALLPDTRQQGEEPIPFLRRELEDRW